MDANQGLFDALHYEQRGGAMRTFTAIGVLIFLLMSACGYKEGISVSKQSSYLYFTGDTGSVTVSIDGGERFGVQPGRDHLYEIQPGTHSVRIYRGSSIVVERQIYISDGVSKEIGVN